MFQPGSFVRGCLALALVWVLQPLPAAALSYGDFLGTNVTFEDVEENSGTDPVPLYGSPTVAGDNLLFSPTAFTSTANNANPSDVTDGQLNMKISVNNPQSSFRIAQIVLNDAGDYTLTSHLNTAAEVSAVVNFRVSHVNFTPLAGVIPTGQANLVFTPVGSGGDPFGGRYVAPADGGSGWTGTLTIDVDAFLIANGRPPGATRIELFVVDNQLETESHNGGTAFIAKKSFTIGVVPEPGSLLLLLGASAGLAALRRARAR